MEYESGSNTHTQKVKNEKLNFCSVPRIKERTFAPDISPGRARLIMQLDKKWINGTKLRYYFFENGPFAAGNEQMDIVREGFEVWKDVGIGIVFEEISNIDEAEIRIGFLQGDGAWSYIGRDILNIPGQHERTMNFGWDLTSDPRGVDTPVHEIGHTLGFPHEHQNPNSGIEWEQDEVYEYFGGYPNYWDQDTTFYNILRKIPRSEVTGSEWDPNSIMHYSFPGGLINKPEEFKNGLQPELGLSDHDREQVRSFYPPLEENDYSELEPFDSQMLMLEPAEQKNFYVNPPATREYTIQTFGRSDTVLVLFEDQDNDLKYVKGDDDSGTGLNSQIKVRLYQSKKYVLRVRLYLNYATGKSSIMMW